MSAKYHQNVSKISPKCQDCVTKISPIYRQDFTKISPNYHSHVTNISPICHQNINKMSAKCHQYCTNGFAFLCCEMFLQIYAMICWILSQKTLRIFVLDIFHHYRDITTFWDFYSAQSDSVTTVVQNCSTVDPIIASWMDWCVAHRMIYHHVIHHIIMIMTMILITTLVILMARAAMMILRRKKNIQTGSWFRGNYLFCRRPTLTNIGKYRQI